MSRIWTAPRQWLIGELVDDLKMMEVSNSLEWLKYRPRNWIKTPNANYTPTIVLNTQTAINDAALTLTITTTEINEEVMLGFNCPISLTTTAGNYMVFDWLMDGVNYVSNMSASPVTWGSGLWYFAVVGVPYQCSLQTRVVIPTIGTHTFVPRAKMLVATSVMTFAQSGVLETYALDI